MRIICIYSLLLLIERWLRARDLNKEICVYAVLCAVFALNSAINYLLLWILFVFTDERMMSCTLCSQFLCLSLVYAGARLLLKLTIYTIKLQSCHYLHAKCYYKLFCVLKCTHAYSSCSLDVGLSSYHLKFDEMACNSDETSEFHSKIHTNSNLIQFSWFTKFNFDIFATNSCASIIGFGKTYKKCTSQDAQHCLPTNTEYSKFVRKQQQQQQQHSQLTKKRQTIYSIYKTWPNSATDRAKQNNNKTFILNTLITPNIFTIRRNKSVPIKFPFNFEISLIEHTNKYTMPSVMAHHHHHHNLRHQ